MKCISSLARKESKQNLWVDAPTTRTPALPFLRRRHTALPCGVIPDQFKRSSGERFSRFNAVPGRSTGRMRESDNIEAFSRPLSRSYLTDQIGQCRYRLEELRDSQFSDWDHQAGRK
jgi:hypothetical protein